MVISHDVDLVNTVWFLDADRGEADIYNVNRKHYLATQAADEARRRERFSAERKAPALNRHAAKLGATASRAAARRT